jgi:hypothetical protein
MLAEELFETLTTAGCRLISDGERLRVQDPHGALTDPLRQAIQEYKARLLTLLTPRACRHCGAVHPVEPNPPELLCAACGEVVGYLTPTGIEAPTDPLPIAQADRAALFEYEAGLSRPEAEALARLQAPAEPPPRGAVGRHGAPCPQCGDTWQWPTTTGRWVCSGCVVQRPGMPQVAPAHAPAAGHTYCPGCGATALARQAGQTTCQGCGACWLPSVDLASDAPTATIRVTNPQTGQVVTLGMYRCPQCRETRWGPRLDAPELWHCLPCAGSRRDAPRGPWTDAPRRGCDREARMTGGGSQ